jgi:hypothetical protein
LPFFAIPFPDHGNCGKEAKESTLQTAVKAFIHAHALDVGYPNPGRSDLTDDEIVEMKLHPDTEKSKVLELYQAQAEDDLKVYLVN